MEVIGGPSLCLVPFDLESNEIHLDISAHSHMSSTAMTLLLMYLSIYLALAPSLY